VRDEDVWFVIYKGTGNYKLKPRNRAGWLSFAAFMTVLFAPMPLAFLIGHPFWGLAASMAVFPLAFIVFARFAKARARTVDLDAVDRDWAEFEAWKKRGKR
jgi:hypothetical protein